jgi:hypothetical protein
MPETGFNMVFGWLQVEILLGSILVHLPKFSRVTPIVLHYHIIHPVVTIAIPRSHSSTLEALVDPRNLHLPVFVHA